MRETHGPVHGDGRHQAGAIKLPDDRVFGFFGQVRQGFDFCADIIQEPAHVAPGFHAGYGLGLVVPGGTGNLLHVIHPLQCFTQPLADGFLHIRSGGTPVFHGDADFRRQVVGEGFPGQVGRGEQTHGQNQDQQQVTGGRVPREPADHG